MSHHSVYENQHIAGQRKYIYIYIFTVQNNDLIDNIQSINISTLVYFHNHANLSVFLLKVGNGYLLSLAMPQDYNRFIDRDPKVNYFQFNAGQT